MQPSSFWNYWCVVNAFTNHRCYFNEKKNAVRLPACKSCSYQPLPMSNFPLRHKKYSMVEEYFSSASFLLFTAATSCHSTCGYLQPTSMRTGTALLLFTIKKQLNPVFWMFSIDCSKGSGMESVRCPQNPLFSHLHKGWGWPSLANAYSVSFF